MNTHIIHPIIQEKHRRHNAIKALFIEPGTLKDYQDLVALSLSRRQARSDCRHLDGAAAHPVAVYSG